jgi:lipopolysaccharide biosynthesis protein
VTPSCAAFYLPQFHPIPENDAAWGPGFTEWTNIARARSLFRGHLQPRLPGELGFYDLRLADTRAAQAELAKAHGIDAFCYYHYWFSGHEVLQTPLDQVVAMGEPDFPFFVCWANENWTRVWDGGSRDVLLEQVYSDADDRTHLRRLAELFADTRYVHVGGRPLLLVYRSSLFPDARRTLETWADESDRLGIARPWVCAVESFPDEERDPRPQGFDAAVEFAPQYRHLARGSRSNRVTRSLVERGLLPGRFGNHLVGYEQTRDRMLAKPESAWTRYGCATPGWDNTPRRRTGGLVLMGATPQGYETWARAVAKRAERLMHPWFFVNAWNEWAEGAVLEPDHAHGRGFLEAHRRAVSTTESGTGHSVTEIGS